MKDIKQFIKSIILFIPFSMVLYIVLIIIASYSPFQSWKPTINYKIGSYGHMYSRIKEIKNYRNIDILFLGSSHAYRSFDTRIFKKHNLKCFNLGSSSQTLIQTDILLRRYLDSLNPKFIILEVSPMILALDGIESSLDLIANDKKDIYILTNLINWHNIKTINTSIVGFYRSIMGFDENFIEKRTKGDDTYISGGFVEKKIKYFKPQKFGKKDIILNKKQIAALERCIDFINSENIKFILVQAPISKGLYSSYSNIQVFDSTMSKYGRYYNFNELLKLNDSIHFLDSHHLNQIGVEIFDNRLINLMGNELQEVQTHNNPYKPLGDK